MRTGWHGGGASYEGAALAVPMTRLQITPQREQGRTKRKPQQAPSTDSSIIRGEVNGRLQIRTALSDGRRRRRRRRRNIDDRIVVVDGWCNEERDTGDSGAGGGLGVALVDVLDVLDVLGIVDRRRYGGAFGAVGEGVGSGVTTSEVFRDRDTTSGSSSSPAPSDQHLVNEARRTRGCNGYGTSQLRQHAALPHGQEMEGLPVAGSCRRSTGRTERSFEHSTGAGEPRDTADFRVIREEATQA